ncbi:tigger transposable element-derived protein 7-like [Colletes gigas]|uniref:tigger transposable element-derived protein 7-like n=1 Tax=Colletes gigas TaxID=935657 RepID=UPI001C9B1466|nr:tigger transposable element-derived protein 7-like [Colletes gigas]
MASTPAGRIHQITYEKRLEILQKLEEGATADQLAAEYNLHKRTIQKYRKNATSIRQFSESSSCLHSKRIRPPLHGVVDARLYRWVLERRALGENLTDNLLQEKAMKLHAEFGSSTKFVASNGWLECFKKRHNIRFTSVYREKSDMNTMPSEKFSDELRHILIQENIDERNVYNMYETSLMWKALPQRTLVHTEEQWVKSTKIRKDRVTVAFCANATGTHKLPPLFIHKYANPRALKHCKHILPVIYKNEQNAWINKDLFNDWYINHFKPSVKQYQLQHQHVGKVLLLMDNYIGQVFSKEAQEEPQFKLMFFPSNTTTIIQPMNQGVISKCKKLFRHKLLSLVLQHDSKVKQFYVDYDIKDCIDLIAEAWDAITPVTIQNSWRKILYQPSADNTFKRHDSNAYMLKEWQQFEEIIHVDDIIEWITKCEKEESIIVKEENTDSQDNEIEQEIDYIFNGLTTWTKTQPEFIKLHANILIDYYNQK